MGFLHQISFNFSSFQFDSGSELCELPALWAEDFELFCFKRWATVEKGETAPAHSAQEHLGLGFQFWVLNDTRSVPCSPNSHT